ncbi:MAG: hypothetical protein V4724_25715 [Pseudomonadota bacterium]
MSRVMLSALLAGLSCSASAAQLTEMETRWLSAGAPVLAYAKQLQLPIDIIVQPQAKAGDVPLAMGFDGGRCKLVLSMRGNPAAGDILAQVPAAQQALMVEAMTAHEIGHCWRYAQGIWHELPNGFQEPSHDAGLPPELRQLSQELRNTRREEAFSDLVALAWIRHSHPGEYAQVYGWLEQVRRAQPASHSSHDTRAWLALAADGNAFAGAATPFDQARIVWSKGLLGSD